MRLHLFHHWGNWQPISKGRINTRSGDTWTESWQQRDCRVCCKRQQRPVSR